MNLKEEKRLIGNDGFVAELKVEELKVEELKVEELKGYDKITSQGVAWNKVADLIKKHNKLIDLLAENNVI